MIIGAVFLLHLCGYFYASCVQRSVRSQTDICSVLLVQYPRVQFARPRRITARRKYLSLFLQQQNPVSKVQWDKISLKLSVYTNFCIHKKQFNILNAVHKICNNFTLVANNNTKRVESEVCLRFLHCSYAASVVKLQIT